MSDLANLAARFCKMNCPVHATEQSWPHDPDCETLQAAVRDASARIKGDKGRENPAERPHIELLTELAHQYLSDLRYPPSPGSRERRIEWAKAVIAKVMDQPDYDPTPTPEIPKESEHGN